MRFGTRNVRYRQRAGSKMAVGRELAKYRFDLVGVQEVIWDKGALNQQTIVLFSVVHGVKIVN